jgi:hypothetical protein
MSIAVLLFFWTTTLASIFPNIPALLKLYGRQIELDTTLFLPFNPQPRHNWASHFKLPKKLSTPLEILKTVQFSTELHKQEQKKRRLVCCWSKRMFKSTSASSPPPPSILVSLFCILLVLFSCFYWQDEELNHNKIDSLSLQFLFHMSILLTWCCHTHEINLLFHQIDYWCHFYCEVICLMGEPVCTRRNMWINGQFHMPQNRDLLKVV